MIAIETLVIILSIAIILLIMGVWGCYRIIIGLKMERDIVIRQLKHAREAFDEVHSRLSLIGREYRVLAEEHRVALGREEKLLDEYREITSCFNEAQQGWKECSEQLDTESKGLGIAHATIERLTTELASADENVRVGKRFIEQHDASIKALRTHVTALQQEIAGEA